MVSGLNRFTDRYMARERTARQRMVSLSAMFEGLLPKGLMSRPTTLMRN